MRFSFRLPQSSLARQGIGAAVGMFIAVLAYGISQISMVPSQVMQAVLVEPNTVIGEHVAEVRTNRNELDQDTLKRLTARAQLVANQLKRYEAVTAVPAGAMASLESPAMQHQPMTTTTTAIYTGARVAAYANTSPSERLANSGLKLEIIVLLATVLGGIYSLILRRRALRVTLQS